MIRPAFFLCVLAISSLLAGCRPCFLLNPYANAIDSLNDTHAYFDNWYYPRLDISRAGKPDWCGPLNSRLGKQICYLGCYDRYDKYNLYPPSNPYSFPGNAMPEPTQWTPPAAAAIPNEIKGYDGPPAPAPSPEPPVDAGRDDSPQQNSNE